jgi:hypothetical protein
MAVPQEETGAGVRPRDGHATRFYTFATTTVLPVMLVLDGSAALLAIGCGVWWYGHPARLMDEKTFISRLSCLQLLGIAGIAGAVFWTRRRHGEQASPSWRVSPSPGVAAGGVKARGHLASAAGSYKYTQRR